MSHPQNVANFSTIYKVFLSKNLDMNLIKPLASTTSLQELPNTEKQGKQYNGPSTIAEAGG